MNTVEDYILLSLRYLPSNAKSQSQRSDSLTPYTARWETQDMEKTCQMSFRFSRGECGLPYRQSIKHVWIPTPSPNLLTECIISVLSYSQRPGLWLSFFFFLEHSWISEDQFWIQTNSRHCSTCQWHLSGTFREIDYRGSLRLSNEVRLAFLDNICNDLSENEINYPPEALFSYLFEEGRADE